ncbi:MAG: oligosaccharide flippase family protein [Clostridiales bacterium]|nr:oligosaccharide flippase family protein [Clostridiales bacterium]
MGTIREKWNKIPLTAKVSLAYAVSSIIQKCLSFFTMPIFTHMLTKPQYGQYTIYSKWNGFMYIFLTLNLAYGSFSTAMVKFDKDRDGYIASIQGITLLLTAIFLIIYLPFNGIWNQFLMLPTEFILLMVADVIFCTSWSLWSGKMRFEFKYKAVVAVSLLAAIVAPAFTLIIIQNAEEKGYVRIFGYAIVNVVIGLFFFVLNFTKNHKVFNKEYWKYALSFNIPLLAYYLSQVVFNQSDSLMIGKMLGEDHAAVYGVAYSLAMVLTFVLNAINNSYVPWFYGKLKEGKGEENKPVSAGIALLMAILLCGVIWFAPEFVMFFGGPGYEEAMYVIPPVAMSLILLLYSQFFINVEFYHESKKDLVWASIGAAAANLILNYLLIPSFGIVAAAYTTLFSYVLFALCNFLAMRKLLKRKGLSDNMYNYKALILIFIAFAVTTAAGMLLFNILIARIATAVAVLAVLIIKRKYFLDLYGRIKGKKA